jgi:hypothetical protein
MSDANSLLVIDAANVVGSRPTGWWRDRPGAARDLHRRVAEALAAGALTGPAVLVLEGAARRGVPEGEIGHLRVVHAAHNGDDAIVALVERAGEQHVTVVTADHALRERVKQLGAEVSGPRSLLDLLDARTD